MVCNEFVEVVKFETHFGSKSYHDVYKNDMFFINAATQS